MYDALFCCCRRDLWYSNTHKESCLSTAYFPELEQPTGIRNILIDVNSYFITKKIQHNNNNSNNHKDDPLTTRNSTFSKKTYLVTVPPYLPGYCLVVAPSRVAPPECQVTVEGGILGDVSQPRVTSSFTSTLRGLTQPLTSHAGTK